MLHVTMRTHSGLMNGFKRPLPGVLQIFNEPLTGLACCLSNTRSLNVKTVSVADLFCHFWIETRVFLCPTGA